MKTRKPKPETVSDICNRLADKHELNVTKVRDLMDDLRRIVFGKTFDMGEGLDIYLALKDAHYHWVEVLGHARRAKS